MGLKSQNLSAPIAQRSALLGRSPLTHRIRFSAGDADRPAFLAGNDSTLAGCDERCT
jgi:hypothetical protein